MNLGQRLAILETTLRPDNIDIIKVEPYQTKKEATEQYEKEQNKKIIPGQKIVYVMILPEVFNYEYVQFQNKNKSKIDELWNNGFSLDEISKKYFVDGNSVIPDA